ncbi:hypothetical protein B7P43_G17243 [Cryptotermes secundus]|uniref:Uncharacterized protein n=1 Tax=Cryptotermes secundus TaxID=105785 RepID=A0A2J7Q577_9NEOP|nr:hypothetical protein B7P43_G17243 [Cryptotermes secundus]
MKTVHASDCLVIMTGTHNVILNKNSRFNIPKRKTYILLQLGSHLRSTAGVKSPNAI